MVELEFNVFNIYIGTLLFALALCLSYYLSKSKIDTSRLSRVWFNHPETNKPAYLDMWYQPVKIARQGRNGPVPSDIIDYASFVIPLKFGFSLLISQQTSYDYMLKQQGLNNEITVGDPELDNKFHLSTCDDQYAKMFLDQQ